MSISTRVIRLRHRRTRIVATLGPASDRVETIRELIRAGANTFRLNLSHGTHENHAEVHRRVREVAESEGAFIGILADLCGPKIRVGHFPGGGIDLIPGKTVTITTREVEGAEGLIPSHYRELAGDVKPGNRVLMDDGRLEVEVVSVLGSEIECRVVRGGRLRDRKGINLPGVEVSAPALTPEDREDARFAARLGVEFVALSFVRRSSDVLELRRLLSEVGSNARIIAKIEKPEALEEIEGILEASDGIMVARGDLGVELPPEEVPVAQAQLIEMARNEAKPVIVATQMLESMMTDSRPTRAEVSDVGGAVTSGADAVMLSGETAAGAHPVEAVRIMDRVCREVEGYLWERGGFGTLAGETVRTAPTPEYQPIRLQDAIARAVSQLSRDLMVRAVVVLEGDGRTAAMVSAGRPQAPVLVGSADPGTLRSLSLFWGVVPALDPEIGGSRAVDVRRLVEEHSLASPGDHILEVSGFHEDPEREVPAVRVVRA